MAEAIAHVSQTNAVLSSPAPANQKARPSLSLLLRTRKLAKRDLPPCRAVSAAARQGLGQSCLQGQGGTGRHGNRCLLRHPSTRLQASGLKALAARRCQGGQGQADSAPGSRGRKRPHRFGFCALRVCWESSLKSVGFGDRLRRRSCRSPGGIRSHRPRSTSSDGLEL